MRVVSVVGTRSDLVQCAPIARALGDEHVALHTGRPFGHGTNQAFFEDLGLALPVADLGHSCEMHADVLRPMLSNVASTLDPKPDWLLVYGASAATLAGVLVAAKLHIPVGNVGSGLRSYRRHTPDEVNHIVVDHLSKLHFCPTAKAVAALESEDVTEGVYDVGDVLLDNVVRHLELGKGAMSNADLSASTGVDVSTPYAFATVHHHENTADESRLAALIDGFSRLPWPVILPLHPDTQERLMALPDVARRIGSNISIVDPLGPIVTLMIVARAQVVLTDSGGLQRESYYVGVPCVTLRDDSEWVDTIDMGFNVIAGADAAAIVDAASAAARPPPANPAARLDGPFGDGTAAERIVRVLRGRAER